MKVNFTTLAIDVLEEMKVANDLSLYYYSDTASCGYGIFTLQGCGQR